MSDLIDFLFRTNEAKAKELAPALAALGVKVPLAYGKKAHETTATLPPEEREILRRKLLLETIASALVEAVRKFDEIDQRVVAWLKNIEFYKTLSAALTAVLSSGVVGALLKAPEWAIPARILGLVSAVITVIISRSEGGDLNIAKEYGAVAARHEAARNLAARIAVMAKNPDLFDDVDERYKMLRVLSNSCA